MDGKLKDDQKITITKEDLMPEGDSQLIVGDTWKASDLRDFTLLTSSNDGAFALAAVAESGIASDPPSDGSVATGTSTEDITARFVKEMNDTAAKIAFLNSKFYNEHGLDMAADKGGAYGSARDMAALFEYTIKNYPEILEVTRYKIWNSKVAIKNIPPKIQTLL